jgi:hypothetical protein
MGGPLRARKRRDNRRAGRLSGHDTATLPGEKFDAENAQ